MSRPRVMDMECLRVLELESSLSGGYMCCNASWACSVYTSSFPAHEPTSNCALRCEPRCLSREKKLNLRGEERMERRQRRCDECDSRFTATRLSVVSAAVSRVREVTFYSNMWHLTTAVHQNCIIFGKLMADSVVVSSSSC